MASATILETIVENVPGWAYVFLLMLAFVLSLLVSRAGLRMLGGILHRMRRLASGAST